jgi:hypothetical protein
MLVLLAALFYLPWLHNAAFTLCPLCVARDLGWCEHDYPRWGGHTLCHGQIKGPVRVAPASIIGSELPVQLGSDPSLCPVPIP